MFECLTYLPFILTYAYIFLSSCVPCSLYLAGRSHRLQRRLDDHLRSHIVSLTSAKKKEAMVTRLAKQLILDNMHQVEEAARVTRLRENEDTSAEEIDLSSASPSMTLKTMQSSRDLGYSDIFIGQGHQNRNESSATTMSKRAIMVDCGMNPVFSNPSMLPRAMSEKRISKFVHAVAPSLGAAVSHSFDNALLRSSKISVQGAQKDSLLQEATAHLVEKSLEKGIQSWQRDYEDMQFMSKQLEELKVREMNTKQRVDQMRNQMLARKRSEKLEKEMEQRRVKDAQQRQNIPEMGHIIEVQKLQIMSGVENRKVEENLFSSLKRHQERRKQRTLPPI